jgi:hypothetical protein
MAQLLEEEGAVLLQRGRLSDKEQFMTTARRSLHVLIKQLRAANVTDIQMELKQETLFFGVDIGGSIDMTVMNAEGAEAVIDIKWGGAKYRKESLAKNSHLQLVTYAFMRHLNSTTKSWPAVAYFVIDAGLMLAQDNVYFPNALVVSAENPEKLAVIWEKMRKTWLWRRGQLNQGRIELTVTGTEPDVASMSDEGALEIPKTSDSFNHFKVLTSFGGGQ